ncbi:MAG TPA: 2-C-methyl-D-erythritol 4-phosphate cytidylyltransferase [Candidatus Limnocylindria bacterium]|nr:2-C-methyl-D-erythritol 4-phosphate cytidylyltransferase [Candidatus Limnocylindria bacterium]
MGAVCAILAAGSSTRAGSDKVDADLGGQPVLAWSLAAALASGAFDRIVVVTRGDRVAAVEAIVRPRAPAASVIAGGNTRTASSWAALDAAGNADVIAIHDSARPFAPPSLFARCVEIARKEGSAVAGLPLADTVRRADEAGAAIEEVSREGLWSAQTPQVFRRELLVRARAAAGDRTFGDDAGAVTAAGLPVRMVVGERRNLKITTIEDLAYARELVAKGLVGMPALQIR